MVELCFPLGSAFEGDMELDPDQMAALMEQMSKQGKGSAFASIKAGLWLTNGKPDNIKYYIDPQICKFALLLSTLQF